MPFVRSRANQRATKRRNKQQVDRFKVSFNETNDHTRHRHENACSARKARRPGDGGETARKAAREGRMRGCATLRGDASSIRLEHLSAQGRILALDRSSLQLHLDRHPRRVREHSNAQRHRSPDGGAAKHLVGAHKGALARRQRHVDGTATNDAECCCCCCCWLLVGGLPTNPAPRDVTNAQSHYTHRAACLHNNTHEYRNKKHTTGLNTQRTTFGCHDTFPKPFLSTWQRCGVGAFFSLPPLRKSLLGLGEVRLDRSRERRMLQECELDQSLVCSCVSILFELECFILLACILARNAVLRREISHCCWPALWADLHFRCPHTAARVRCPEWLSQGSVFKSRLHAAAV